MREALTPCCKAGEQTRYTRARPLYEQEAGLASHLAPPIQDPWLTVIGEIAVGFLLAAAIIMVSF